MTDSNPPDIDFDALARRYTEEREKRLRADGLGQYLSLDGAFASFDADPNASSRFEREPVERSSEVLIIGGGYAGLLTAVQLRKHGVTDITIIEKGADFGGTWYWNRYPGVRCDVESYIYMPLLEETGFVPSEKYAKGAEILEQCRLIARKFDLYQGALFRTIAQTLVWNEATQRWRVRTNRGDTIDARFVVSATGIYSSPKLPRVPGIESFKGAGFHTSRWDYGFTGGDADGHLTGLKGKKVGIIGTGSTGIQCVPPVAEYAGELYLFQRTPASVDIRGNGPTDVSWFNSLPPGWEAERVMNFTLWTSGQPQGEDMVNDSMSNLCRETVEQAIARASGVDEDEWNKAEMLRMERVRRRVESIVKDKATAAALKPYFHYFCKRPGFSDDYLQIFNRPNVTLVDTAGTSIEKVTSSGLVVRGREYELDCIIYATGFDFMTSFTRESGLCITGRAGKSLADHWNRGARTLFGMHTDGFPNLFLMSMVQAGFSVNYRHSAEEQSKYVADLIAHCMKSDFGAAEPTSQAVDEWVALCVELSAPNRKFHENCTPGYLNFEGKRPPELELNAPFGGGPLKYYEHLHKTKAEGFATRLALVRRAGK